jgi:hypothetical protein
MGEVKVSLTGGAVGDLFDAKAQDAIEWINLLWLCSDAGCCVQLKFSALTLFSLSMQSECNHN